MVMINWLGVCILLSSITYGLTKSRPLSYSGCADGTTEGLQDELHPKIAACEGSWVGHVQNSTGLCSPGWKVCDAADKHMLGLITWEHATGLTGCYAFNAAQDGGQCRPCINHVEQDDLAGVGRGCPHQSYGQNSCISGGQIDVSCCVDTHFNKACQYRPGLATGILCCKIPGVPPQILVRPHELTHVQSGVTFVLSCVAMGDPTPTVQWFKKGHPIPNNISRISVFESGYLLISGAVPSDSGRYTCVVSNTAGHDTAVANVLVTDHPSGCADGTTDGLAGYEEIQACKGKWIGHVKRAKSLCAKGWQVCNPRHGSYLKLLTWEDVSQLDGCYAYNAANTLNQCARCHRGDMAGVGSGCGKIRRTYRSCLAEGRIDVYKRSGSSNCHFSDKLTTGAMCCKKPKKNSEWVKKKRLCSPKCINGGLCDKKGRCVCPQGWKGAWCQNALCPGGCIPNSTCIKPGVCRCNSGYTGKKCKREDTQCLSTCLNGGRCRKRKCKCPPTHTGEFCQYAVRWRPLYELNRTEK